MQNSMKAIASYSFLVLIAGGLLSCKSAETPKSVDAASMNMGEIGDVFDLKLTRETKSSGKGSSGNSRTGKTLTEAIIAYRDDGVVLEFDLPAGTDERTRLRSWQFPVRVFRAADGALSPENIDELQSRSEAWQERMKLDPAFCGKWVFTWTAQKIECDPQSAIEMIEPFMMWHGPLAADSLYKAPIGLAPVKFTAVPGEPAGTVFTADMILDARAIIREKEEADAIMVDIMGERAPGPRARAGETYKGTVSDIFTTDANGRIIEMTRVAKTQTLVNGVQKGQGFSTQTVTRKKSSVSSQ